MILNSEYVDLEKTHTGVLAKILLKDCGNINNVGIEIIKPHGGGPNHPDLHRHDHMFIVVEGEIRAEISGATKVIKKDESIIVDGRLPHSIWNDADTPAKVVKISINR